MHLPVKGPSLGSKEAAGSRWSRAAARLAVAALLASSAIWTHVVQGQTCDSTLTPVKCENQLTGNPASEWDITGAGDSSIQGFATNISVNRGSSIGFKITSPATFNINIYRLGYYAGKGARKITTISTVSAKTQASCLTNSSTGLIDCGNWTQNTSWTVPSTAASGIYIAKISRTDTGGSSHIVFVVRDDSSHSDLFFQTSDTTWQAYNSYGGNSLYVGAPGTTPSRAYKVSYNRPFNTRASSAQDWVFNAEYPMVRWLEANGYNVTYTTGVDSDRSGSLIKNHKVFLSVGHDEYWSGTQRTNVEAARTAGVHLAFLSGNEVFWKTRWENSTDGSNTTYRTLVSYKETHKNAKLDPTSTWTGTWMDPRFSPPADGGRPQNALTGTLFTVNCCSTDATIKVPQTYSALRFWRNTRIASLGVGSSTTLSNATLGYEWDSDVDNGFRPAGLMDLSSTTVSVSQMLLDYGSTYGSGTATHQMTLYKHASGALVFSAGTVQWTWGLDGTHDRGGSNEDDAVQQAMVNLLADMSAQPTTLQSGLTPATASTDTTKPTSTISAPAAGASAPLGTQLMITGTAADTGGGVVAAVEVSVDNGVTWRPASGRTNWSFGWTPAANGIAKIQSRAIDDSGNIQTTTASVTITTGSGIRACPCSMWPSTQIPQNIETADSDAVNLGVRFRTDLSGTISGIRYYKAATNTGTHTGSLWSTSGSLLATATFSGESSSGWQQVNFTPPVTVSADTTYVASYHTDTGNYAVDNGYFGTGQDYAPVHFPTDGTYGANGVYAYGGSNVFPNQTWQSSNYWVDVVFNTGAVDTIAPTVSMTAPATGATVSGTTVTVSANASDNVGVSGVQFKIDGGNLGAEDTTAPYAVIWNSTTATTGSHTLTAVARDAGGNTTTSAGVIVTVSNDTTAPTVSITAPSPGATVSGQSVQVTATATDNLGVVGVQFKIDGANLGAEVTAAPYTFAWNSTTAINGSHTLTAVARDAAGNVTTSAGIPVTVTNAASSNLSIDVVASADPANPGTGVTTSAFTTAAPGELLLAFVTAADMSGPNTVSSVAGGGLTWQMVVRTNVQAGTSEVWRAFATGVLTNASVTATLARTASSSLTVVTFRGADASGTNGSGAIGATKSANSASGAPSATVTTTRAGSWVFGAGNDWDGAAARTVPANQTMVHQYMAPTGDTFWVQRTTVATPAAATAVTINDTAPTNHRFNLAVVEVLPGAAAPSSSAPTIVATSPSAGAGGVATNAAVTVTFSEPMQASTITGGTISLRDGANAPVDASVSYDSASTTATLLPTSALQAAAVYTATVDTGVTDTNANPLAAPVSWTFATAPPVLSPTQGSGGPILVVTSTANAFTSYYAEILRAEGLNAFATVDASQLSSGLLANYKIVVLGEQTLTTTQVTTLTSWVQSGGNLIAMRPDSKLATLLGLGTKGSTLTDAYLAIDTTAAPGQGLVSQTMQYHGAADQYTGAGATVVARLYSSASSSTNAPAVTTIAAGAGTASAFTYDLAKSVVYTRQGNPAWAGQERDGTAPIRSDDLFFGAKAGDIKPDWVDFSRIAIPQADEQQRLLANMILQVAAPSQPMPRFWYFPNGNKAVVVMSGDDHGNGGEVGRFAQFIAASPAGCNPDKWECVRGTAYLKPTTPITDAQVASFVAQGFEIALHVTMDPGTQTGCGVDYTTTTLANAYTTQIAQFVAKWPSAPKLLTHRMHCLMWSDWLSQPTTELSKGIRLDTSYYYWPPAWINDTPGLFTGSGMPMRYAGQTGSLIDVFQAVTQMTDESGQTYPFTINTLLDNAIGSLGYYGAFTANMHVDVANSAGADAIVASAKARSVPIVSAKQMLTWLDGRNSSSFASLAWNGTTLTFSVVPGSGTTGLQLMLPTHAGGGQLLSVTLEGTPAAFAVQTIKGVEYALLPAQVGHYAVVYAQ